MTSTVQTQSAPPSLAVRGGLAVVVAVLMAMHVVVAVSIGLLVYWRTER
jgi:hypothetical protein